MNEQINNAIQQGVTTRAEAVAIVALGAAVAVQSMSFSFLDYVLLSFKTSQGIAQITVGDVGSLIAGTMALLIALHTIFGMLRGKTRKQLLAENKAMQAKLEQKERELSENKAMIAENERRIKALEAARDW